MSQGSFIITLLYISTVGEDLNLFSLKPGILTETFRDGLEKDHILWKSANKAEDKGIPTAWAKPMLQQCPHGKC